MKPTIYLLSLFLLTTMARAQEMVRVVRWISPVTKDFESMPEGRHTDAQLQGWGYTTKTYQYSAYKTRGENMIAVYRWTMPNCAGSIMFGEHELTDAQLQGWGYKDKEFQFYAYRTKPPTGDFVAVNRWINAKPQGDPCRDFTLTIAETELTDAQLRSWGYTEKKTQFWVPRPGMMRTPGEFDIKDLDRINRAFQLSNPDFETGNLNNWIANGNGFQIRKGDLPLRLANWGSRTMPLGGDYWQGLTPNFTWNNGRQGNWFAGSSQTMTGSLVSAEFVPQKKFISFLIGGNAVNQVDKNNLRVELLVLNDGTFPSSYQKSVLQERLLLDPRRPGGGKSTPIYRPVTTPFQQVTIEGKSYFLVEDLTVKGDVIQATDLFIRKSFDLSATKPATELSGVPERASLIGRKVRLRIVDESSNGYIYFDDVIVEDTEGNPVTAKAPNTPLWGFVDMHTHPMANLGFGQELVYGSAFGPATVALGSCNCTHNYIQKIPSPVLGVWIYPDGYCEQQNRFRNSVVDKTDEKYQIAPHDKGAGGFPNFGTWPRNNSVLHQQMYVDWIRRAYDGGLRVMVALAVNSHVLADAAETAGYNDDLRSMNTQIAQFVELVNKHRREVDDFFEIAYSAADLRRIIQANKLALVIGTETDNLGNFYNPADGKGGTYKPNPTDLEIKSEIDRLYSMGVRYVFPIHVTNNLFGGSAIYDASFNVANKYNTGSAFSVETVETRQTGINFGLTKPDRITAPTDIVTYPSYVAGPVGAVLGGIVFSVIQEFIDTLIPKGVMPNGEGNYPNYPKLGPGYGHRNTLGLTRQGEVAVKYMMTKGMMIDIDHMSEKTANTVLGFSDQYNYPVNSGHNGPRGNEGSENARTDEQYTRIFRNGGMASLGMGEASLTIPGFRQLTEKFDKPFGFGSDANGLYPLPSTPVASLRVDYGSIRQYKMPNSNKVWDYNTEGMAHYGLFPDYLQSLKNGGMTPKERTGIFSSAEYFAQMWEKCEQQKTQVR